ncbi:NDR1/HIN1-like protein 13 [Diospyros lotus]|uniref:NDR1/HIN1-like protein 13 n=1 Tax=Diospyros lotus TaxID=55363 RepID=UPI0022552DE2|nr:NDR1/HIN1-like protein 13 [Diospyros lotus]XP_052184551.1 NDR1/HIN1-like protein 13 [Diospyros lotus]
MAADRVHPRYSPPSSGESSATFSDSQSLGSSRPSQPPPAKPVPPPLGAYVVQIPKDQIYRYPPPENARRYRKKPRRGSCCRCLCCILAVLVVLAAVAGVLYLVFRPKSPSYSVEDVSIRGFNLTSPSSLSPEFDVTVRAQNPNDKIGIYYEKGSSVTVYYSDVELSNGALPVFYQPSNNFTVFQTVLRGSNVLMGTGDLSALVADQKQRKVPFRLNLEAPVKIKVGAVKTWKITVKVKCGVTVDNLTASSKIVSKECDYSVKIW